MRSGTERMIARPLHGLRDVYSCTSHAVKGADGQRIPYGAIHARRIGAGETACGVPARDWPMHFDIPFDASDQRSCRDCGIALGLRPQA